MQSTLQDIELTLEIRVWARNEKEKDNLANDIFSKLTNIQFITNGSINNDYHDFKILSSQEVQDEGQLGIKSRVWNVRYRFFNIT